MNLQDFYPLALLSVGAVSWLIMFLGTRLLMPQIRKLGDGPQMMIALVVSALVTSVATHYGIILPDGAIISADNLSAMLAAWLTSMGAHEAVKKPIEQPVTVLVRGPTEGL